MIFRIRYKNLNRSFFRFVTIHAFDGQTDGQTNRRTDGRRAFLSLYRVCISCCALKIRYTITLPQRS